MDKATENVIASLLSEDAGKRSYVLQLAGDFLRTRDAEPLKQVLFNALQQERDSSRTSELIWVLGKSGDAQFAECYRNFLRKLVDDMPASSAYLYQALIALDNCGEPIFEHDARGRSSQNILNVEKNLRQAETYLAKLNAKASL